MKRCFFAIAMVSVVGLALGVKAEDGFVELTGTQVINTGYKPKRATTVKLDFQLVGAQTVQTRILGCDASGNNSKFAFHINNNGNFNYSTDNASPSAGKSADTARYTVSMPGRGNANLYNADGSLCKGPNWTDMKDVTSTYPLVIGGNALNASGTSIDSLTAKMKVYGLKIYESGTLVYDFKPVVKGGVAGLYDENAGVLVADDRDGHALAYGGDIETLPADGYVQSNGSSIQGINSRFFWQPGAKVEVDYELTDSTKNSQYRIVGADWGGVVQRASVYIGGGGVSFGMGTDATEFKGDQTGIDPDKRRHTVIIDTVAGKYYYKTGIMTEKTLTPQGACTETAVYPMGLMAGTTNQNGSVFRHFAKMKLYRAKFWLNGELKHDYVPCVKGDVAGLKDLVDGQFVTSGALTYGGNILKEDDDPYLENTDGVNYIDTGYKLKGSTKIEADFAFRSKTVQQFVFEGADGNANNVAFRQYVNGNGCLAYRCSNGNNNTGVYVATGDPAVPVRPYERHQFTLDPVANKVIVEDAGYTNWLANGWLSVTAANENTHTLKLFSSSDGKTNHADIRLYGLRIYEDGQLVRNYVPYLKSGQAGLQDLVNSTFVTGKSNVAMRVYGTVACDKDEDAYLLSDGNQLINSGYFMNRSSRIEVAFAYADVTVARRQNRLFGQDYNPSDDPLTFFGAFYLNGSDKFSFGGGDAFTGASTEISTDLQQHRAILNASARTWALRTIDGTNQKSGSWSTSFTKTANQEMGIFGTPTNASYTGWRNLSKVKIYWLEVKEGDAVKHRFYPAKIGGEVGLYDVVTKTLKKNVTGSATDFVLGGAGYDGKGKDNGFLEKPASEVSIDFGKTATLTAFAPGAVEYRWTLNGEPISVEGLSCTVAWKRQRTADVYSVTPVYIVNGCTVEGAAATTTVNHRPSGFCVIIR